MSGIDNYAPGYIDRENEVIVGLQTDAPLKRIVNLYGGTRMAKSALEQYGYQLDPEIEAHFTEYRKTHNEGVFDAYPERTRAARHAGERDARRARELVFRQQADREQQRVARDGALRPRNGAASSATTAGWPCTAWTA